MKNAIGLSIILVGLLFLNACRPSGASTEAANAWATVDKQGAITLFGKEVQNLEEFQASLYDSLTRMESLPDSVPVYFDEEILMGMRGEVRTAIDRALAAAAARKECEAAIHGFYTWYEAFQKDSTRYIDFVDAGGKHLKLDTARLDAYLAEFRAAGFVGQEFIDSQRAFYKSCEKLWQNEPKDEPPSCLDADPYFCAQDWDLAFWTTAPVFIVLSGDRAAATMRGMEGGSSQEHDFEMVKENGKWVIAKIECDMGID